MYMLSSGVMEIVVDNIGANPSQLFIVNPLTQTTQFQSTIGAIHDFHAASANPLNFRIAWDSQFGLVSYVTGGQTVVLPPGQPVGAPLNSLAHDAFGRLFGSGDHLYRIHTPSGAQTQIGASTWPDFAGFTFFRTNVHALPQNYCTAQVTSLGCTPVLSNLLSYNSPSLSAGAGFNIRVSGLPINKPGLFFYGVNGRAASPFQGGFLCVQPPLRRTPLLSTGSSGGICAGTLDLDFNTHIATHFDPALEPGATVDVQAWSRDPGAPSTTNLSGGLEFVLDP